MIHFNHIQQTAAWGMDTKMNTRKTLNCFQLHRTPETETLKTLCDSLIRGGYKEAVNLFSLLLHRSSDSALQLLLGHLCPLLQGLVLLLGTPKLLLQCRQLPRLHLCLVLLQELLCGFQDAGKGGGSGVHVSLQLLGRRQHDAMRC